MPDCIKTFIPMATSEHVKKALNGSRFEAKLAESTVFNILHGTNSIRCGGKAETDTQTLQQKREALVKDAKIAAAGKLTDADKGKTMPKRFVLSGIRREHILEDSLLKLKNANTFQLLAHTFMVSFKDEPGVDAGGVTRDWFHSMAQVLGHDPREEMSTKCKAFFGVTTDNTLMPQSMGLDDDAETVPDEMIPWMDNLYTAGRFLALSG